LTNPAKQNIITTIRGSNRQVADIKSEPRPASNRNRWPASYWNAWPASSESAPAIEAALLRLAADPQLLRRLRVAARRKSLTFAWSEIARRRLALYEEAIERKRSLQ
jgi:glycosyltransferase involved in cell wall biosynthesis